MFGEPPAPWRVSSTGRRWPVVFAGGNVPETKKPAGTGVAPAGLPENRLARRLLAGGVTTGANYRGLAVRVFLFGCFVTFLAVVVEREFQIKLLLSFGKLLFSLDRGIGVASFAFLNRIPLLPDVLSALILVVAFGTGDLMIFHMLLVSELHGRFGGCRPESGLNCHHVRGLLFSGNHHE